MDRVWITNGSTTLEPVVNPVAAACYAGYCPTDVFILDNPSVNDVTTSATSLIKTIVTAHGGDEPAIEVRPIDDESDFDAIVTYLADTIEAADEAEADVAVDVTPGRKFWSFISFQAGHRYDVDHLYYILLDEAHFGELYPDIPRPAIDLIDFTEVL